MDIVTCNVCKYEYNASRMDHTCLPEDLELLFLQESVHPEVYNLNADDLRSIKREIAANGSPEKLVKAWERSAGRPFDA